MSFLPIVQRELRVLSRRKSTIYTRCITAAVGMIMSLFLLLAAMMSGGRSAGNFTFTVLSWYALLVTLLAGIFLASDSLSEERREGTLGLLFLTDLKGYDVVLGKFMAISLNAFYGLLAFFPVLAISLLAGGVTGGEFWRTCLALLNLLFFSVAAAMLISSFSTSGYRAMIATIVLLVICLAATIVSSAAGLYYVAVLSPFRSFFTASGAEYFRLAREFWISLAVSQLVGWIFLGLAALRLRRFVDKGKSGGRWQKVLSKDVLAGKSARRTQLLEINPVLWLLDDSRRMRWVAWLLCILGALTALVMIEVSGPAILFINYAVWPFYFLLKIFIAIQACRFFVEARRTGALELLCCTPLTMRSIIGGQWMLLRRVFLWPYLLLLAVHSGVLLHLMQKDVNLGGAAAVAPGYFFFLLECKVIPNNLADFFAIGWFGMWLGFSMQRPNWATGLTILAVTVLPMLVFCVPTLACNAVFITVGWVKLSDDFRLRQFEPVKRKLART
jgi:ABC-type transport system involved in multi-copper enzyme maturation permease subunit